MDTGVGGIVGLGGMVSEVPEEPEETVGFLWAPVIADLYDIIPSKNKIKKRARGSDTMKVFLIRRVIILIDFQERRLQDK